MVQLPATAAIEYVAACCRTRTRTRKRTKTGTKTKIGTITKTVRGAYARSPKFNGYTHRRSFLCLAWSMFTLLMAVYIWPSRSVTDKKTKKKPNRQTKKDKLGPVSAGSRPTLPKFSGYVEVDAPYIFHRSTIWVRPLFTELGPKNSLLP